MPYLSVNHPTVTVQVPAIMIKAQELTVEFLEVLEKKLQEELEKERGCECEDCEYAHGLRDGKQYLARELSEIFAEYTKKAEALLTNETL